MSGPLMHQACMEQCRSLLSQIGITVDVGSKIEQMLPDTHGSHGWNFPSGGGSIIEKMEGQYKTIKELFKGVEKSEDINRDALSRAVRYLCHYTEDAHTIGQISSDFWGKYDNRIDAATEFCWSKKAYPVQLKEYGTVDEMGTLENIKKDLLNSMRAVYDKHKGKAKKWYYPCSGQCRDMARNAVKCGAEFAAAYVKMASR